MSRSLLLECDPVDQPAATDPIERSTWCSLRIRVGERYASRIWDKALQSERTSFVRAGFSGRSVDRTELVVTAQRAVLLGDGSALCGRRDSAQVAEAPLPSFCRFFAHAAGLESIPRRSGSSCRMAFRPSRLDAKHAGRVCRWRCRMARFERHAGFACTVHRSGSRPRRRG